MVSSRPRPWLFSWSGDPLDEQVDDLGDLFHRQLVEDDHLVDAVQELGPEAALQLLVTFSFIFS